MLRVVSYNIHSGRDLFWRKRLAEMMILLRSLNADIIGLQEVHENSKYGFQAQKIAEHLQYHYIFAPTLPVADGYYGNALFTRIPIAEANCRLLPASKEPRSLLSASLPWQGQTIETWVTHLSLSAKSRKTQLAVIEEQLRSQTSPVILLGDFNTQTPSLPAHLLDCAQKKERHTLPTLSPFPKRIDFIYVSPQWEVVDYEVIKVALSDHYPLLATLKLTQPPTVEG
ncbi:endonuclease/exonuclease/phosphatase family protein [Brevibacillus fulvus]|nr:endonuclease/exonuclease/phosphatase family protein [Brevibacillus fulvus]